MKPTEKLLVAMVSLRANPDFQAVIEAWNQGEREEMERVLGLEGKQREEAVGAVKLYRTWKTMAVTAPEVLQKILANKPRENA